MNNENKKSNNLLLWIIIILLIILIGIGGVLVYTSYSDDVNTNINNYVNENNKVEEDNNKNEDLENDTDKDEVIVENLNLNSDLINIIVKKIDFFNRGEFNYTQIDDNDEKFGILYKNDKLLIKDLPAEIRMGYVVDNFDLETEAEYGGVNDYGVVKYIINNDKFKQKYFQLMGKDVNYEPVVYDYICPSPTIENGNIIFYHGGCGGTWEPPLYKIFKKYTRAEKNNNEVYLYEKIAFVNINLVDDSSEFDIYSDIEHTNLIANSVKNENEIFSSKYINKFSEYKYTFKLEDGNYIFHSVEKVK